MVILGIETSCDDTGIAIVKIPQKGGISILSNIVSSQIKVHQKYGGVVPNLAAREHLRNIEPCLKQAFREVKIKPEQVDLIAVTIGPGLIPSLLIGVHFAKTLAYRYNKPIIGVNHLEAHIIAALTVTNPKSEARNPKQIQNPNDQNYKQLFPAIALVVSGGHTQLILVKRIGSPPHQKFGGGGKYKILGETRDDAAGECFDKVAKLLGLGYPGGPIIAAEAAKSKLQTTNYKLHLPRPMIRHKNYDFSFSGLKTAVLYLLRDNKSINIPALCKEVQQAIIDVLIEKTIRAAKEYKAKAIILSGGVAANQELRKQFKSKLQTTPASPSEAGRANYKLLKFFAPAKNLCTDNGAMIAMAGYLNREKATKNYNKIKAEANLRLS